MKTEKLYEIADKNGIKLEVFPLRANKAVSLLIGNNRYIALAPDVAVRSSEERVCLAHELGHCQTNGFYEIDAPVLTRKKCEARAEKWAVQNLIPKPELVRAVKYGCSDIQSLADYFSVTEDFIKKAIKLYFKS